MDVAIKILVILAYSSSLGVSTVAWTLWSSSSNYSWQVCETIIAYDKGIVSGLTFKVWVFFGDGFGDLGFWIDCFGETEVDSIISFLFLFSLEGLGLSSQNVVFGSRIGDNRDGGLCSCEDSNRVLNILGGRVKNRSDSCYLWRLLVYS